MIKKYLFRILILPFCLLFILCLGLIKNISVSANQLNDSYNFNSTILVDNYNYFISLTPGLTSERLQNYFPNMLSNDYSVKVSINNTFYNSLFVVSSEGLGGIEIYFYNSENNSRFDLLRWYSSSELDYINNNRFNIYFDDNNYTIQTDRTFNTLFYVSTKINGYFTFNRTLTSVNLPNNNFDLDSFNYERINGSFVYQTEDYLYLFNGVTYSYVDDYIIFDMYSSSNTDDLIIDSTFTDDKLRYLYFDNQYIDYYLYNWLETNGTFDFVYYNPENASFWDLINAYINIPITIFSSMLSFSIFETGTSLLLVFATLLTIIIAFKVVKLMNWL